MRLYSLLLALFAMGSCKRRSAVWRGASAAMQVQGHLVAENKNLSNHSVRWNWLRPMQPKNSARLVVSGSKSPGGENAEEEEKVKLPVKACPPEGDAWVVFQERTRLRFVSRIGIGQHSELLFCYLSPGMRNDLGLPEEGLREGAEDTLVETEKWLGNSHMCYGIVYGATGIDIYEKHLGEPRMHGAKGQCGDTVKFFKGCIYEWHAALPDGAAISVPLPSRDDDGWWLLPMIHVFETCQTNWKKENYNPVGILNPTHNCNGFGETILDCALKLSPDLHLNSRLISNNGFQHTCDCAAAIDVTGMFKTLKMIRKLSAFWPCEGKWSWNVSSWFSSGSISASSSSVSKVKKGPPGCYQGAPIADYPRAKEESERSTWRSFVDPLYMVSMYQSGCYCDDDNGANCRCKVKCDKRLDCGVQMEQSRCTWCCVNADGPSWEGATYSNTGMMAGPTDQANTCSAVNMDRGTQRKSLFDAKEAGEPKCE